MADAVRSAENHGNSVDCTVVSGRVSLIKYRGIHMSLEEFEDLHAKVSEIVVELDMDITQAFGDDDSD